MKQLDTSGQQFIKASEQTIPTIPFREAIEESPDKTINSAIPIGLALGVAFASFVAVGLIALGLRLPVRVPLIASGSLSLFTLFFWMWRLYKDRLIYTKKRVVGRDSYDLAPLPTSEVIHVIEAQFQQGGRTAINRIPLPPMTDAQYRAFLQGLAREIPLSEANWCGGGRPFSKKQFLALRRCLLDRGVVEWRDKDHPTQGVRITDYGNETIRSLLEADYQGPNTRYLLPEPVEEEDEE